MAKGADISDGYARLVDDPEVSGLDYDAGIWRYVFEVSGPPGLRVVMGLRDDGEVVEITVSRHQSESTLSARLLQREIRFGRLEHAARVEQGRDAAVLAAGSPSFRASDDLVVRLEAVAQVPVRGRGRPRLDELELARFARAYVEQMVQGGVTASVFAAGQHLTTSGARDRIRAARRRGLLTKATGPEHPGKAYGSLTDRCRALLEQAED